MIRISEIPSHSEFENSSLNDRRRPPPCSAIQAGVGGGFSKHRVRVQRVIDVEVRVDRVRVADLEDLAESKIELVQAVPERGGRIEHVDGFVASSTDSASQRRR